MRSRRQVRPEERISFVSGSRSCSRCHWAFPELCPRWNGRGPVELPRKYISRFLAISRSRSTMRDRSNVRTRVLEAAIARANRNLAAAGRGPVQEGVTNHTCRRTFASLLYEAGASPAYVMAQLGHTSSALALEVYAKKMERQRNTGARMDALIRAADWAQAGTNSTVVVDSLPVASTAGRS